MQNISTQTNTGATTLDPSSLENEFAQVYSELTTLQMKYVDGRITGLAPSAAARAAGAADSTKVGRDLERHPKVNNALVLAAKLHLHRSSITREDVLQGLMDALPHAVTAMEEVAIWTQVGKIVDAYAPEKHLHVHSIEDKTLEQLQEMSDHELLKAAGKVELVKVDKENDDPIEAEFEEIPYDLYPEEIDYGV